MSKPTGKLAHAYQTIANMEARIDALLAERDAIGELLTEERMVSSGMVDLYRDACKERDAAQKDAERYRWLRDKAMESGDVSPAVLMVDESCRPAFDEPGYGHVSARSGATLDAAIDEALQGAQP